ncbi:ATP-binding protein [Aquihabitans sp. McL0605]|uniref:DNA polymerase III subunit n=1 Tax=Aquihabitans sp. McL0605 TaxID=3415671 RepID=UPI003CF3CF06
MSTVTGEASVGDAWSDVVGQEAAVAMLRHAAEGDAPHAWLFVGPHGSGKRAAARAFAGDLLAAEPAAAGDVDGAERARLLARQEQHPDLIITERVGATISVAQAADVITRASRSPIEGSRKVLLLDEFHLIHRDAGPKLLKTIEEPPAGTFFLVLADEVTPDLITIASRCVRVDFAPLTAPLIAQRLELEGLSADRAAEAAAFAGGDLDRARLLATDERLALRLAAWRDLPRRLDGSGSTAAATIADLRAAIDDAEAPLKARHEAELAALQERVERYGQRGSGMTDFTARQKRESRRLRTDELRMGLGALASAYRDELAVAADPKVALEALAAIQDTAERLEFNPNEELQLIALAVRLPGLL